MASPKLILYFDIVSPFAYLAWYFIRGNAAFSNCKIEFVPVWLAGIMRETDNRPPLAIKNKAQWIDRERIRWATSFSIPMVRRVPEGFPIRTLDLQRALCIVQMSNSAKLPELVDELYRMVWAEREPVNTPETFRPVFENFLGETEAAEALGLAQSKGKQALMDNTTDAVRNGAFGLPWFVATDAAGVTETFWGFDQMRMVMDHLGLDRKDIKAML